MTTLSELWHEILNDFCSRVQDWWDFTVSFERKTSLSWKRSSGNVENSIGNPVDFFLLWKFILIISENTFSYDNFVNFLERNSESIQFKVQDWWNFFYRKFLFWKTFHWIRRMQFWKPCGKFVPEFETFSHKFLN